MKTTELEGVLRNASLHVLVIVASRWLSANGFGDVQVLDRRLERQRSRYGGHELECRTNVGNLPSKVIVKIVRDSVRTRMLDELAGAVMRTGADRGLILTPYRLAKSARPYLRRYQAAKIDVIDGGELSALLARSGIGVRGSGSVDFAYFGGLEEVSVQIARLVTAIR